MKLLFMGRKWSGARALAWSVRAGYEVVGVVTDVDNPDSEVAGVARREDLPLLDYSTVMKRAKAGSLDVDVAVSFVFWKIIKEPLLSTPPHGIINFHPAPLPEYKGTAGYNVAILEELDEWSVTAHYMDDQIDTGGIIDDFSFSIDPLQETATALEQKSQQFMVDLYRKTMRRVLHEETLETRPNRGGRYISLDDMEAMKKIEPGDDIDKKIRAFWFPPYHGAQIELDGKTYTLVNERILKMLAEGNEELPPAEPTGESESSEEEARETVEVGE